MFCVYCGEELPLGKVEITTGRGIAHPECFAKHEEEIITGDIFIHKRTGIKYVFYHENLGTRIELMKD